MLMRMTRFEREQALAAASEREGELGVIRHQEGRRLQMEALVADELVLALVATHKLVYPCFSSVFSIGGR